MSGLADRLYFKALDPGRVPRNGGLGKWPPPGKWAPPVPVDPCVSGYHLFRPREFWRWAPPGDCELWLAEGRGECVERGSGANGKVVFAQARLVRRLPWDDRLLRLFACDCAERALGRVDKPDPRSVDAVRVSRLFAGGKATRGELSAAGDAAWYAAWDAAGNGARAAAWYAARAAAWDAAGAAWYAARDAARADAWYAAGDAEGRWQMKHLLENYLGLRADWEV